MNITILLPPFSSTPIGGYKVLYEHANRLQEKQCQVTIIHPITLEDWANPHDHNGGNQLGGSATYTGRVPWFSLRQGIELHVVPDLSERWIPKGDVVIA